MECFVSLFRLRNTGLINAGEYRVCLCMGLEGLSSDQIVVVQWERKPVSYSVRSRLLEKHKDSSDPELSFCSSAFVVDYDEEEVHLDETCLFHFNVSAEQLLDTCPAPACLQISLELFDDDTGAFKRIGPVATVELPGERYGLVNECTR
jgi:hypothetical protein